MEVAAFIGGRTRVQKQALNSRPMFRSGHQRRQRKMRGRVHSTPQQRTSSNRPSSPEIANSERHQTDSQVA
jgi:hypothetical protein